MVGGNRKVRTPKRRAAILKALAAGWSVTETCRRAGLGKTTYFVWRQEEPEFEKECLEAIESGIDLLEDELYRRATTDKSDALLIFALKGKRPNVYNRKTVVLEGSPDKPLQTTSAVMIYPRDEKS